MIKFGVAVYNKTDNLKCVNVDFLNNLRNFIEEFFSGTLVGFEIAKPVVHRLLV